MKKVLFGGGGEQQCVFSHSFDYFHRPESITIDDSSTGRRNVVNLSIFRSNLLFKLFYRLLLAELVVSSRVQLVGSTPAERQIREKLHRECTWAVSHCGFHFCCCFCYRLLSIDFAYLILLSMSDWTLYSLLSLQFSSISLPLQMLRAQYIPVGSRMSPNSIFAELEYAVIAKSINFPPYLMIWLNKSLSNGSRVYFASNNDQLDPMWNAFWVSVFIVSLFSLSNWIKWREKKIWLISRFVVSLLVCRFTLNYW